MRRGRIPDFEQVTLADGRMFLMQPVLRGMCKYESIKDGTLDLADFALMNDAIAVETENAWRAREAFEKTRGQ